MQNSAPIRRIDHDSDSGCWTLWRRPASPRIAPYVTELQGYVESGAHPVVRDELPSGLVHLIIVLGPGFTLVHDSAVGGRARLDRSFVAGLHRTPAQVGSCGEALCLQVDFTPLGARRFFRSEMRDLTDRVVDFQDIAPRLAPLMDSQMSDCRSWEQRLRILEAAITERVLTAPDDDRRVAAAWHALHASGGTLRVESLAKRLNVSRKHLNCLFAREVGMAPKSLARILRFATALRELETTGPRNCGTLADLAARCGYADQAHFTRDFKAFAGDSPTALSRRILQDGTGILAS